jgi:hypothetical protein
VDLIRSGRAPEVIRRKGAEGNLPLPAAEKIEILTLLAGQPEVDLRAKALETLKAWDGAEMRRVMANPETPPSVLRFATEHLVPGREELRDILLWNPSLPVELYDTLEGKPASAPDFSSASTAAPRLASPPVPSHVETPEVSPGLPVESPSQLNSKSGEEQSAIEILAKMAAGAQIRDETGAPIKTPPECIKPEEDLTPQERLTLIEKVSRMTVVEKMRAALTGNLETRSLLIRDSNKIVSRAVLQSPKISETEAENYAAAKNVSEEVLRLIAANRKFMKAYVVMRALVNNPRAPIDITMPLILRLNDRDIRGLALNRNVPDVIRSMAIKAVKQKAEAVGKEPSSKR